MRRRSTLLAISFAAATWLAAGPGFVGIEAALLCRHHYGAMGHHGHQMPAQGSCFCDQMVGALDAAAPDALPELPGLPAVVVGPVVLVAFSSPVSRLPSPVSVPPTPPPIASA
jgi:hypothetical protein